MRLLTLSLFALTLPVLSMRAAPAEDDQPAPKFEVRALRALTEADREALRLLAAELSKLPPAARRKLPLRVREDSVEFAFHGEFPGDQFRAHMLEYLVSGPAKDYESLLVVPPAEQERVQALRPFFEKRAREGGRKAWSAQLLWIEGDTPQSIDLGDLLLHLSPKAQSQFFDQLGINRNGLGGNTNVRVEAGLLPRKRVPARLLLTIRMPPEG